MTSNRFNQDIVTPCIVIARVDCSFCSTRGWNIHRQPSRRSGQTIIIDIAHIIEKIQLKHRPVELHRIPAQIGIERNEQADRATKESTGWRLRKHRNNRGVELDTERLESAKRS